MAIYHCHIDCYRRSEGKSAVGGLAYRRGLKMACTVTGKKYDFRRKEEVIYSEFISAKCDKREHDLTSIKNLFEQIETTEKHPRGTLGREIECALPNELTAAQQVELTKYFIEHIRTEAAADEAFFDYSIHAKDGNNHVHIAMSERELEATADGYRLAKNKRRDWHEKTFVQACRTAWEVETNNALERAEIAQRVDSRTLAAQSVERIPTLHEGKGRYIKQGERKMLNEKIKAKNQELLEAHAQTPEGENLSQIYGAESAECGSIDNADPEPEIEAARKAYQFRLAASQYEGFSIYGLTFFNLKNPRYVTLFFVDKSKIVDYGHRLTASGGTATDNARRMIELARLKQWKSLSLSGSIAFVEAAMLLALAAGLDVSPADEEQRKIWERIQATATAASSTQVIARANTSHVVPPSLADLGERLGNRKSAPAPTTPKRGRGLGL